MTIRTKNELLDLYADNTTGAISAQDICDGVDTMFSLVMSGPAGQDGSDGTNGNDGAPGSVWRDGSGAPSNGSGINGDYYLDDATGNVYLKSSGTYSIVANIKGATGSSGSSGSNGSDGAPGSVWRNGSGAPSNGTGIDGDFYLDTANGNVYKRTSGTYSVVTNIIGPTGATGSTGPAGPSNVSTQISTSVNGAASAPALLVSGAPYTAGTTTSNYPLVYLNVSGSTQPSTLNANGTFIGVNSASGYTGNWIDCKNNGSSVSAFRVAYNANLNFTADGNGSFISNPSNQYVTFGPSSTSIAYGSFGRIGSQSIMNVGTVNAAFTLTNTANNSCQVGNPDAASPANQNIGTQNVIAGTSNGNGSTITRTASLPTGTGNPGTHVFSSGISQPTTNQTATISIASPAVVTSTAHGFAVGNSFTFSTTGALPTGITAGTTYYVTTWVATNQFRFSATQGGTEVNTSGTQSGTHTITATSTLQSSAFPTLVIGAGGLSGSNNGAGVTINQNWGTSATPSALSINITGAGSNNSQFWSCTTNGSTVALMRTTGQLLCQSATIGNTTMTAFGQISTSISAASSSTFYAVGAPYSAGTATTNFPQFFSQPTGTTAVTTFSTGGTVFGANESSSFSGNFISFHLNGSSAVFTVGATGNVVGNNITSSGAFIQPNGNAPATSSSTGNVGQIAWDSGNVYVCVATNTWKRSALSTF